MYNSLLAVKAAATSADQVKEVVTKTTEGTKDVNDLYVVVLGLGIVFIGLISIIILCKILSVCCKLLAKKEDADNSASAPVATAPVAAPAAPTPAVIPNRRETVAAIAAAIAEDLGTDVSAIRILSIEKL